MMLDRAEFAIDASLPPALAATMDYWCALRRGEADIPFADDLDLRRAQALCADLILIEVFESPERFRLDLARTKHAPNVEADLQGRFLDKISLASPLDALDAQAAASVEQRRATLYRHPPAAGEKSYARLVLPMWGEGQVKLLLAAIAWL